MLPLFYSELYTGAISDDARFPKHRYRLVREGLSERGIEHLFEVGEARKATRDELLLVHDAQFVDDFLNADLDRHAIRRIGFRPWKDSFVDLAALPEKLPVPKEGQRCRRRSRGGRG